MRKYVALKDFISYFRRSMSGNQGHLISFHCKVLLNIFGSLYLNNRNNILKTEKGVAIAA